MQGEYRQGFLWFLAILTAAFWMPPETSAQVCNIRVVTDANPDYSDMQSLVRSVTSRGPEMPKVVGDVLLESSCRRQRRR